MRPNPVPHRRMLSCPTARHKYTRHYSINSYCQRLRKGIYKRLCIIGHSNKTIHTLDFFRGLDTGLSHLLSFPLCFAQRSNSESLRWPQECRIYHCVHISNSGKQRELRPTGAYSTHKTTREQRVRTGGRRVKCSRVVWLPAGWKLCKAWGWDCPNEV